jgi:beta-lactamase regulating signal transducer with metallopeptidase domain
MLRKSELAASLLVIAIAALVLWFNPRLATATPPIWSRMACSRLNFSVGVAQKVHESSESVEDLIARAAKRRLD